MADRSNSILIEQYVIPPATTQGITVSFGQYALGLQIMGGTAAITNDGGSYANGFYLASGILGLNTASTVYLATAAGSTAIIQVLKTVQGASLGF